VGGERPERSDEKVPTRSTAATIAGKKTPTMGQTTVALALLLASPSSCSSLAARKANLLAALTDANQGRVLSKRPQVDALIELVEELNPQPRPLEMAPEKLSARWRLVYTTSSSILGMRRPRPFRPRPRIFQHIDVARLEAKNEEWILGGLVKNAVRAKLTPRTDGRTVDVGFTQFRVGGIPFNVGPGRFKGVLETTFLDDELRISRGDRGNLFVLVREGPPAV